MSAAGGSLCEDQFLCSICLDVFTRPVSTPCGHNFCRDCISKHWDVSVPCGCPNCKKVFHTRPDLQVNTFVSEMVAHFRWSAEQETGSSSSSEQRAAEPGEVPCDVCTGSKPKALKSCLVCLASYCETHLEPHMTASRLKRHQLIEPVENLEGRVCTEHGKPLELFCTSDQMCVCALCSISDHKMHSVVPLKEEYDRKTAEVGKTEAGIRERRRKIQEFKRSVEVGGVNKDREVADVNYVFAKLKEAVERNQAEAIETIEEKHRATEKQAEGFIAELEEEICSLEKRSAELERLQRSGDHLNLVQNFKTLTEAPAKDWSEVLVCPPTYEDVRRTVVVRLVTWLRDHMMKLRSDIELKRVRQFAADVTLDPDTASNELVLSDDGKRVHHGVVEKSLPFHHRRFSDAVCVLGKQSISSGRFYFEVQVERKTSWVLGVTRESANRKGLIFFRPQIGYWLVKFINERYRPLTESYSGDLPRQSKAEKVGVFVDYDDRLVSFYDVGAASLIYAFTDCAFAGRLHPFFCPYFHEDGKNAAPLIICPVEKY